MSFAKRLKLARGKLTQLAAADAVGLRNTTISRYEQGKFERHVVDSDFHAVFNREMLHQIGDFDHFAPDLRILVRAGDRRPGGVENLGFDDLRTRLGPIRRGQGANAEQRDSDQQRQHGVSLHPRSCRSSCLGRRPHRIEYAESAVVWEATRFDCDRASARIALRRFVPLTRFETWTPALGAADVGARVAARARLW